MIPFLIISIIMSVGAIVLCVAGIILWNPLLSIAILVPNVAFLIVNSCNLYNLRRRQHQREG